MNDDRYDNLKKKYDALVEENEYLRAKIRKLESQQNFAHSLKVSLTQNTQHKQRKIFEPNLKPVNNLKNIEILSANSIN